MTYKEMLREHAQDQYGFVTTKDAVALDVPPVELRKLAARGALEQIGYGLYRVADAPRTNNDEFAEAVFRAGPDAFLTHDAVLALHGLGNVNPRAIRVATPRRTRASLPPTIKMVVRKLPPEDLTYFEGIRTTTVARAIRDCRGLIMDERLQDTVREAERKGYLRHRDALALLRTLRQRRRDK